MDQSESPLCTTIVRSESPSSARAGTPAARASPRTAATQSATVRAVAMPMNMRTCLTDSLADTGSFAASDLPPSMRTSLGPELNVRAALPSIPASAQQHGDIIASPSRS